MDINKCARGILARNIKQIKKVQKISKKKIKEIIAKHICKGQEMILLLGYKKDVVHLLKCFPKKVTANVVCEYINADDWINLPGKEFNNEKLVEKIANFKIDKLIIASEDMRYLLQMYLLSMGVSYEIVDIYETIKKECEIELTESIGVSLYAIAKQYIKRVGKLIIYGGGGKQEQCDNYDAILVKRLRYKYAKSDKDKKYYLSELIISYLKIKDYRSAFFYIDEYVMLFGETNGFAKIKQEFSQLLLDIKKEMHNRKQKDIIVFWCDALSYRDFVKWDFLKEIQKDSLFFENAYTHVPYTHTTIQAIFTGQPFFDGKFYHISNVEKGKTIDLLENYGYRIYEPGCLYIDTKYTTKLDCIARNAYQPASIMLWETLAQILKDDEKKFIICHMDCELHNPYWNGQSEKMRVDPGNFLTDISDFLFQRRESADYVEKQILYYSDLIGENACKIYMSDHGSGGVPPYAESRLHAFCFVKDSNIVKGRYKKYFSYLNFYNLIQYILNPTKINFQNVFSDYVLIQNDHPFSEKYCDRILLGIEKGEDVCWKKWMGFRGIIKGGYKLIRYPGCHESWFGPNDIEIHPDSIQNSGLVEDMRKMVGNIFPDIYEDDHYVHTRKLYEKLGVEYQDKNNG